LHGLQAWDIILTHFPHRTSRQLRERWNLYVCPEVKNDGWSAEEEQQLFLAYQTIGPKWALIVQKFPSRTSNGIKNKVKQLLRRVHKTAALVQPVPELAGLGPFYGMGAELAPAVADGPARGDVQDEAEAE
jgi:hypothetical protein